MNRFTARLVLNDFRCDHLELYQCIKWKSVNRLTIESRLVLMLCFVPPGMLNMFQPGVRHSQRLAETRHSMQIILPIATRFIVPSHASQYVLCSLLRTPLQVNSHLRSFYHYTLTQNTKFFEKNEYCHLSFCICM